MEVEAVEFEREAGLGIVNGNVTRYNQRTYPTRENEEKRSCHPQRPQKGHSMNRQDFLKLIGAKSGQADYLPVACLLKTGYACAGFFNSALNDDFTGTCVLVNARLVELAGVTHETQRSAIHDFNEFIEHVVTGVLQGSEGDVEALFSDDLRFGKSIPLSAISFDDISVVYPVGHISTLLRRVEEDPSVKQAGNVPTFLDFENKSVVLKILKTKLW